VLLGAEPEWADPGFGYVLPDGPLPTDTDVAAVRAFCEKPPLPLATRILAEGALWNTFIMVCRARTLLAAARSRRPVDVAELAAAVAPRPTRSGVAADVLSTRLPAWNFSTEVLSHVTSRLVVLRVAIGWSDWGTVDAIERTLAAHGATPPWRTSDAWRPSPLGQRVA
jgi:mannose-1-phosphate guanylyltransferase